MAPQRQSLTVASPAGVAVRWFLVAVGVAGAANHGNRAALSYAAPLAAVAALRTLQIVRPGPSWARALWPGLAFETLLVAAIVGLTGVAHSPWMVVLVGQMGLDGAFMPSRYAGPFAAGGLIALLLASVVARPFLDEHGWVGSGCLLALVACTFAYASWVFARGERHRALLAEANSRLAATNAMLVGLDRASPRDGEDFDPRRCARSMAITARTILQAETIVVLASTALPGRWQVLHAEGGHLAAVVDDLAVPGLHQLVDTDGHAGLTDPVLLDYADPDRAAVGVGSSTGLLLPLRMHDRLVGALLLEHSQPQRWGAADSALVADLAERAALMLDNARRFNALWVVGASEERTRVAHDLHDHLGQSMAALGLELDVLARRMDDDRARETVRELRGRVTGMVGELRGTMRDLRCDVSEDRDLAHVLSGVARDLDARSEASVEFTASASDRLPLAQEHQLLLIARQALTTAVADAGAGRVWASWTCDAGGGCLEVGHDAGDAAYRRAADRSTAANLDALAGIEDRCRAIGARLLTDPSGSIRCEVNP